MPAVTSAPGEENNDADQKMWNALKKHIIRDRQRKKEEYEAEIEEERLRKEREARERQDVMTLEETKEQIDQLEQKLKQLEKEKQQLFMQLKKVLNEDEIRKRQQQKESNEMNQMKMPMNNIQIPMFMPPVSAGQGEPPPNHGRPPPLTSHILNKQSMLQQPMVRGPMQNSMKRTRSPSPTYTLYTQRLHQPPLKHQPVYQDHKMEDGRIGRQMARAVLWNKPSQYSGNVGAGVGSSGAYYAMPSSGVVGVVTDRPPPLLYAHHAHTPHTPHTPHHASLMYAAPQPQLYLDMLKNRDQSQQHQEAKKDNQPPQVLIGLSDGHHAAPAPGGLYSQPPPSTRHIAIHGPPPHGPPQHGPPQHGPPPHGPPPHGGLQVTPTSHLTASKPGSITQGYPVQQNNPNVQNTSMYPNRHRY